MPTPQEYEKGCRSWGNAVPTTFSALEIAVVRGKLCCFDGNLPVKTTHLPLHGKYQRLFALIGVITCKKAGSGNKPG
jgi:hypothetical protein